MLAETQSPSPVNAPPPAAAPFSANAAWLGLCIVAAQVAWLWLLSLVSGTPRGYEALHHWDSLWYERIVTEGYHSPETISPFDIGTVAYFPGYPVATRMVMALTGLNAHYALLATAQLCAWGVWTYVLLLCREFGFSRRLTTWLVALMLLHPVSFFLVAGYSESLFMIGVLGYIYWSSRPGPTALVLAAIHGYVMTATRLVGLPIAAYPVVRALFAARFNWRDVGIACLVAVAAAMGAASFFLFCQLQLGHWDQYMRTHHFGFGVRSDYQSIISGRVFEECRPMRDEHWLHPNVIGRILALIQLAAFALLAAMEIRAAARGDAGWRCRLPLYFCAFFLFYIPVSTSCRFVSMLRFSLPVTAVLLVTIGHLVSRQEPSRPVGWKRAVAFAGLSFCLALNLLLTTRYLRGWWVA
jgi:hypothetical protein